MDLEIFLSRILVISFFNIDCHIILFSCDICIQQLNEQGKNTFTNAPMTPRLVSLKYSNGLDLLVVLRKGYRYRGIWAAKEKKQVQQFIVWNIKHFMYYPLTSKNWNGSCDVKEIPLLLNVKKVINKLNSSSLKGLEVYRYWK